MLVGEAIDIGYEAVWTLFKVVLPVLMIALVVGLVISFLQAITQIQEQTLSFVPKMIGVFLGVMFFMPFMGRSIGVFFEKLLLGFLP